jgi:hypothetical protein
VVVGVGNSAIQIAVELAEVANVTDLTKPEAGAPLSAVSVRRQARNPAPPTRFHYEVPEPSRCLIPSTVARQLAEVDVRSQKSVRWSACAAWHPELSAALLADVS